MSVSVVESNDDTGEPIPPALHWKSLTYVGTGLALLCFLGYVALALYASTSSSIPLSAPEATQLYTQALFKVVFGVAVAGGIVLTAHTLEELMAPAKP